MSFIYLDTSVALAELLAEDFVPPAKIWRESMISSRLLEYEIWNRLHAYKVSAQATDLARKLIGRVALLELVSPVLERAREPFPMRVRTLDALHLASITFLRDNGQAIKLATYDSKLREAAERMRIPVYSLQAP